MRTIPAIVLCSILGFAAGARAGDLAITSLTVVSVDTGRPLSAYPPLKDGAELDLTAAPRITIRANTTPAVVGSVRFDLDQGAYTRVESAAPYALAGDQAGQYNPWEATPGPHTLVVTPYSAAKAGGEAGQALTVHFRVKGTVPAPGPSLNTQSLLVFAGDDHLLWLPAAGDADVVFALAILKQPPQSTVAWSWRQVSGPAARLRTDAQGALHVTAIQGPGDYLFEVTAKAGEATATDRVCLHAYQHGQEGGTISGEQRVWHCITVSVAADDMAEGGKPNPFLDRRLDAWFTDGKRTITVPGFFAADGDAANTSADHGGTWCVRFMPDHSGHWEYAAALRSGPGIALAEDAVGGKPRLFTGSFDVLPTDKTGRDFRGKGLLRYVGKHHLRFAGTGEWFLKGGADSPENFLGYTDFDQTPAGKHTYAPHLRDFHPGDPTWQGNRGRGIIGALNYLASKGMNSVYFITMNVKGDGKDVWPWTSRDERWRFDCSKLDQWEVVFSHMDRLGILLHVLTQETENDQLLDGGELGPQRKLYYRELVARFAHHPGLVWNLGEENTNTTAQRWAFARFIRELDPYDHPIVCHTFPNWQERVYTPMLGCPWFEGASLQTNDTHRKTTRWVKESQAAGRPWVVCLDEIGPANTGVKPDADDPDHDEVRARHLWGNLMGGGAGVEWYFGYKYPNNDLTCEDWRPRDRMWDQTRVALGFLQRWLPFTDMVSSDGLCAAAGSYCFAKPGEVYAVYLRQTANASLDLRAAKGDFTVHWFNPRTGGDLLVGSVTLVTGGAKVDLGQPPADPDRDWVALVRQK